VHYLYHNVNILPILQQAEIGIKVKLVVLGAGVGQDHFALPQGLEEDLLPLCPMLSQQLPLKDNRLEVIHLMCDRGKSTKAEMEKNPKN